MYKVLSVQTFIVPFNFVPLRRTQPCPTMPRGSHESLCSPSLFRTPSQQRLWVLVERELCLFVYLAITDLCSCRRTDILHTLYYYSVLLLLLKLIQQGHWHSLQVLPGCPNLPINGGLLYLSVSSLSTTNRCQRLTMSISCLVQAPTISKKFLFLTSYLHFLWSMQLFCHLRVHYVF